MHDTHSGRLGLLTEPRRNKYFYGKLLDVAHLQMEQRYFNRKRWLLNRLSLGYGVLCGLNVEPRDGELCVKPGVAIDPLGREIIVPATVCINPWKPTDDCGQAQPELSPDKSHDAYLCLEYKECFADLMPVLATECDTRDQCAAGTIAESFRLSVHVVSEGDPPPLPVRPYHPSICGPLRGGSAADKIKAICDALSDFSCDPSEDSCVILAHVPLNARADANSDPTIGTIEVCSARLMAYSNALLFDMILCLAERMDECCKPSTGPVITAVWPANGATLSAESDIQRLISPTEGVELAFDRSMDGAMLGAPDPWLGLWLVSTPSVAPAAGAPTPPATAMRLKLRPVGPTPTAASSKMNYAISAASSGGRGDTIRNVLVLPGSAGGAWGGGTTARDVAFLLAVRAAATNITDTTGKLLDADFAGTGPDFDAVGLSLDVPTKTLADALWDMAPEDTLTFDAAEFSNKLVPAKPPALPAKGSGDGSPGGFFHIAFKVVPQR
jgi:hypothetical protein